MSIWRSWAFRASIWTILAGTLALGCTRTLGPVTAPAPPKVTATFTMAIVNTNTPIFTVTRTPTPTRTITPTFTDTVLNPTDTNTFTPTDTLTDTTTDTPTETVTDTWTGGWDTFTFTETPTDSPTELPTDTPTFSPTISPTSTATQNTKMIDDGEDGNNRVNTSSGLTGYWFTYNDSNKGGTSTVWPVSASFAMSSNPGNGTNYGARFTGVLGTGLGYDFVGCGCNFLDTGGPTKQPFNADVLGYTGIRFDIRLGTSGVADNVRVMVPSVNTEISGGVCADPDCDNHFGEDLTGVSTSWQSVTIFFNLMTQESGWGIPNPTLFDLTQLYGIQWQAKAGTGSTDVDLWVDNIEFITEVGPTPTFSPTTDPNMIDNMEDNNGLLYPAGGRTGYWYSMTDQASDPPGTSEVWPIEGGTFVMSAPGRTDNYAARITGLIHAGFTYPFLGGGFNFLDTGGVGNPKILYDATAYTGFTFWARVETGTSSTVRVSVPTSGTDPQGGQCSPLADCNNNYGENLLPINDSWQMFTVYFSLMTQESGWGYTPAGGFNLAEVYAIQWQAKGSEGTPVDLWIDDVTFITDPAPTPTAVDTRLIDTMEDNDNQILAIGGRSGYWYTFADSENAAAWGGTRSVIWPPNNVMGCTYINPAFVQSAPGYSGSAYAARMTGSVAPPQAGFCDASDAYLKCGFAGMGFDLVNSGQVTVLPCPTKIPYDMSAFTGLMFVAKVGPTSTAGYRLKFPDVATTKADQGGTCCLSGCKCFAHWGMNLSDGMHGMWVPVLNQTWQEYTISFTEGSSLPAFMITQESWGDQHPWDKSQVFGIHWDEYESPGATMDLWVDYVRFY